MTKAIVTTLSFLFSSTLFAANFLVVEGRLTDASGLTPIEDASVDFLLEVLDDTANNCMLYSEQHNSVDLSGSEGFFSLKLGNGSSPVNSFLGAFNNIGTQSSLTCDAGTTFSPSPNSSRRLRISYDAGSGVQTLSQLIDIGASQYANYAHTLGGKTAVDFLQVNTGGMELSQANLESVFATGNTATLNSLIAGSSTLYSKSTPTAAVSFNGQKITNVDTPALGTDAVNKTYSDTKIAGINAAGLAPSSGEVLFYDGSQWQTMMAGTGDFMSNGSTPMNGPLNMNNQPVMGLVNGSAASPALSFSGASGTGIFSPGSDEIAFTSNGNEVLKILPNKNIGIGVTAPTASLHVRRSNVGTGGLLVEVEDGSSAQAILDIENFSPGGFPRINLKNSEATSVGAHSGASANGSIGRISAFASDGTSFQNSAEIRFVASQSHASGNLGSEIRFHTTPNGTGAPTHHATITNDGRLGLGTGNPTELLEVAGGIKIANTASPCSGGNEGTLRHNGVNFEICDGAGWKIMAAAKECVSGYAPYGSGAHPLCIGVFNSVPATNAVNTCRSSSSPAYPGHLCTAAQTAAAESQSVITLTANTMVGDVEWDGVNVKAAYHEIDTSGLITANLIVYDDGNPRDIACCY